MTLSPAVRATLTLGAVLLLGVAIGITADRVWLAPSQRDAMDPAALLTQMDRRLALDATQHAAIARILTHHRAVIDSAWRAVRPGVQAALDSTEMQIYDVLRPAQRGDYMQWLRAAHPGMPMATPPDAGRR